MRVLFVHNFYQQAGGEDAVFKAETELLRSRGHHVITFERHNAQLNGMNPLRASINAIWSGKIKARLAKAIREYKPDVVHFHNTFLMISPAAYYVCKEAGIPVVQTLHNYRFVCPGALLVRDGVVCEECVGKVVPWKGVVYGCWQRSPLKTGMVATMVAVHRLLRTWTKKVDLYIALTEFARHKFIRAGFPPEKIVVKPNFVYPDPGFGEHSGSFVLFVGRLSPEKGVRTLLSAWRNLKNVPLKIVGDGPLMGELQSTIVRERLEYVQPLGRLPRDQVLKLMQQARLLVFPSEWYESFPLVLAEAFATGLPVVASRLGAMAEIIEDGSTGLLFEPGSAEDLADKLRWAWSHLREIREMGVEARNEYERKYTAERNYEMLMEIYRKVI